MSLDRIQSFDTKRSTFYVRPSSQLFDFQHPMAKETKMREILPGIFSWPWFSEPHGYNFNGHFVCHADGNLCIDPVEPSDEVLAKMAADGVTRILITNRNHSRAAN